MSRDASVTLAFADGEHRFRLAIGQLRELQEKCNAFRARLGAPLIGPFTLWRSLASADAWHDDVREVIRLGLIGGGAKPVDALTLVQRYVDDRPLTETTMIAHAVLGVALVGPPDEPIEGKEEPATETETAPTP